MNRDMIDNDLKETTFEDAISMLEKIVNALESNTLPLEKALELFQTGIALVNHCNAKLEEAEGIVEILLKDKDGELKEVSFDSKHEESLNEL